MRYRLQRHDGTDCSATMVPITVLQWYRLQCYNGTDYSATMVPITVLRMVPIQRYRHQRKGSGGILVLCQTMRFTVTSGNS